MLPMLFSSHYSPKPEMIVFFPNKTMKTLMAMQSISVNPGPHSALSSASSYCLLLYLFCGSVLVKRSSKPSWMKSGLRWGWWKHPPPALRRHRSGLIFALPCKLPRLPQDVQVWIALSSASTLPHSDRNSQAQLPARPETVSNKK